MLAGIVAKLSSLKITVKKQISHHNYSNGDRQEGFQRLFDVQSADIVIYTKRFLSRDITFYSVICE